MIGQFVYLVQLVAPVFAVMVAGYAMRKARVLTAEADHSLTRLVVALLTPALALDFIIGNSALARPENWLLPPVLGFCSVLLGVGVARLGARLFGIADEKARRTFVYTACIQNYGYLALPLCKSLFGSDFTGVMFALFVGIDLAFWSIAFWQLTGRAEKGSWRRAINPPIVTIPIAIALNSLGAKDWLPAWIQGTYQFLGACAIPMALILGGALVADHLNRASLRHGGRTFLGAAAVRLLVVPLVMMAAARWLPLDTPLKAVLMIQAAMPAAIFPIVVTRAHDGDMPTALQVVIGTSLAGLVTIPLWLSFGMAWVLGGYQP